jgi:predicted RNA binding protein YcfA (HicA-like mRNA interferase family)
MKPGLSPPVPRTLASAIYRAISRGVAARWFPPRGLGDESSAVRREPDQGQKVSVPKKVREMVRIVEDDGWKEVSREGSHRQYKHPVKRGRVTIPGKLGDDIHPKTERSIFKQAQIERKEQ